MSHGQGRGRPELLRAQGHGGVDLSRVLGSVSQALAKDGWLLFDVNTPQSFRMQYPPTYYFDEDPAFRLVQRGNLEKDGRRARLDFDWFVPAGRSGRVWRHVRETLWHVSWTDREVRRALRLAGFDRVRCFEGIDVRPGQPYQRRGTDAYYLGRKRATVKVG